MHPAFEGGCGDIQVLGDVQMMQRWKNHIRLVALICGLISCSLMSTGCFAVNVFGCLAIAPNAKKLEYSSKVKAFECFSLQGDYLGTEEHGGVLMHHYQFPGLLNGDERIVHILLAASTYDKALAFEEDRFFSLEGKPAWLIVNARADIPESYEPIAKNIQAQCTSGEKVPIICARIYASSGYFNAWNALEDNTTGGKEWKENMSVSWKVRSKLLCAVRPIYAVPAALLCLPVDVVMWIYTPIEMCFRRLGSLTYVNMCEALKEE